MDEYEELLRELRSEIRARGELSSKELMEWGESRGIGVVTLSLLVDDLKRSGLIDASSDSVVVDEHLGIAIPKKVRIRARAAKPKPKLHRQRRRPVRERGTLLKYIFEGSEFKKAAEVKAKEKKEGGEERRLQPTPPKAPSEEPKPRSPAQAGGVDRDLLAALYYLSRYWSVGELRFLIDLKNMGVKDPEALLRRLVEEGVVTRSELGVINANREEVSKRLKGAPPLPASKSLADLFR